MTPMLFNIVLLPLVRQQASFPDASFLLYADDFTVCTLQPDLQRQQDALQSALDKTSDWCERMGQRSITYWEHARAFTRPEPATIAAFTVTPVNHLT
ncbi:hypothetical protein HPB52_004467 [Rhipicephalus sanguineus]|uniref:Reverse transcriptase domain-containing protein n=1 Tax=Rhipicephalus sanguineus TaxID=34632 RepID=A0A9D4QD92_RHISA|nr:hypothetical protein HPB52_004467 [Rhipicephalus sanguineus]